MELLRSIIILDDEPANNVLMKIFLQEDMEFRGGIYDFNAVDPCFVFLEERAKKQEVFPDLLILDVNMPGKGGFEFLAGYYARGYHDHFHTQVILLSAYQTQDILAKAAAYPIVIGVEEKKLSMDSLKQKILQHFYVK